MLIEVNGIACNSVLIYYKFSKELGIVTGSAHTSHSLPCVIQGRECYELQYQGIRFYYI